MFRVISKRRCKLPSLARHRSTVGTFDNQSKLPRLPLPTLESTVGRYLRTLQPLLSTPQYQKAEKAAQAFCQPSGLGPVLQQRLQGVDQQAPHSWLESVWLQKAYLEWREPSYINSNWFALLGDNPDLPLLAEAPASQVTPTQLTRAARLIHHLLDANDAINQQTLPPETLRDGTPLCMNPFKNQFGTTRQARPQSDTLVHQWPSTSRHILVMYGNQTVRVPVYSQHGQRASLAQISQQLAAIANLPVSESPSVAQLTAGHRDDWAHARQLLEQDSLNKESLELVDSALFGVCLDTGSSQDLTAFSHTHTNRWFDKAIQLIVLNNGRLGVNCEHSPVDAPTTGRLLMEMMERERGPLKDLPPCQDLPEPQPIQWNVSAKVADLIQKVHGDSNKLSSNLQLILGDMTQYGSQWIKTLGCSPDAFFQVALQLAYYRHYGHPTPTYESSSLRQFLHGRTETIRSCTNESLQFSKVFEDKDVKLGKKLEAFQRAIAAHVEYSVAAASGHGVDRHLLGLRSQIETPEEAQRATLFQDPSYVASMSFGISTSNVTPGERFRGGFAPVIPDGYGINYALDKKDLKFSVSEWLSSDTTDSKAFRQTIYDVLADLHQAGEYSKK